MVDLQSTSSLIAFFVSFRQSFQEKVGVFFLHVFEVSVFEYMSRVYKYEWNILSTVWTISRIESSPKRRFGP